MALQAANARNAAGAQQQGQGQRNLDVANQQFWQQQQWPLQGVEAMKGALQGVQLPTTQVNQNWGPAQTYSPSPLASLGSLATGVNGFGQATGAQPVAATGPA